MGRLTILYADLFELGSLTTSELVSEREQLVPAFIFIGKLRNN